MALLYDTFDGTSIMVASGRSKSPGTPQRVHEEAFPNIDGVRITNHGKAARVIEMTGFVVAASLAALLAAELVVQAKMGMVKTLRHYVGAAGVYRDYANCLLEEYYLAGEIAYEVGTGYPEQSAYVRVKQLYW